jgi:ferrochelatase
VYDGLVVVSFGGPEGPDDVVPFLQNVTRGRDVPPERLQVVARTYERFGGVSPINAQTRALVEAVRAQVSLPVYWGNRNWHPFLTDALTQMARDGVRRALAFVTSACGSYSSCRQYIEDIERARDAVGPAAPAVDKIRLFYNHPMFIEAVAARTATALSSLPDALVQFTAHSIPLSMAAVAPYESQVREAAALVAAELPGSPPWEVVFQSRSGPPSQPWLGPDINERLGALAADGVDAVVVSPLGFVSDHMEVVYDLDVVAAETAAGLGMRFARASTPGVALAPMVADLVSERVDGRRDRAALGDPWPDACPPGHCLPRTAQV